MTLSAMSVPADTPDDVTNGPSSTHRASSTQPTFSLCDRAKSKTILFEVARRPSSKPAFASRADPVAKERDDRGVELRARPDPAGNEDQVEMRTVVEAELGDGGWSRPGRHRPRLAGDGDDAEVGSDAAEHLQRTVEVQELEVGVQDRTENAARVVAHLPFFAFFAARFSLTLRFGFIFLSLELLPLSLPAIAPPSSISSHRSNPGVLPTQPKLSERPRQTRASN